jgi:preprotein translocase subunit SecA
VREAVYLRAYGQKDPLIEYKNEAYEMFTDLMASIKGEILHNLFRSTSNLMAFEQFLANLPTPSPGCRGRRRSIRAGILPRADREPPTNVPLSLPIQREMPKVGRNEPCPCGSGRNSRIAAGLYA